MSKPLVENPERKREAAQWHREVFAKYGGAKKKCIFCNRQGATDAAHVIPRSKLGPLRYACVEFGRPAHRVCHSEQEMGHLEFPIEVVREAVIAHNKIAKVPITLPVRG